MAAPDDQPKEKPAVLRHEGAHRVSVAPGAHSALSPAPVGTASRLRPAVGPIPASLRRIAGESGEGTAIQRDGHPRGATQASVNRTARRDPARNPWRPALDAVPGSLSAGDPGEWQRRLDQLAQANAETSRKVTALEHELKSADQPPGSTP